MPTNDRSNDLQRQLRALRAQAESMRQTTPQGAEAYLASLFADAVYDGYRADLIAALLSETPYPSYEFTSADGYEWRRITWPDRSQPPSVLSIVYVANWRGVAGSRSAGDADDGVDAREHESASAQTTPGATPTSGADDALTGESGGEGYHDTQSATQATTAPRQREAVASTTPTPSPAPAPEARATQPAQPTTPTAYSLKARIAELEARISARNGEALRNPENGKLLPRMSGVGERGFFGDLGGKTL